MGEYILNKIYNVWNNINHEYSIINFIHCSLFQFSAPSILTPLAKNIGVPETDNDPVAYFHQALALISEGFPGFKAFINSPIFKF